jgi:predicted dehydrogenase
MDATKVMSQIVGMPNVQLTGAADAKRTAALERFRSEFGAEVFDDIEKLCRSDRVDAIYIATPPSLHAQHAMTAARQRKHVIVEKPMALNLDDAERMNDAAEKHDVKLLCGHTHSYDAPIRKMREIVRSQMLGKLRMINTWNFNEFMYRRFTNEDLEATHGILLNQVPHQVDIVRLVGGGRVETVRGAVGVWDSIRTSEGGSIAFLGFADAAATLVYNGRGYFDTAELFGWIGEGGQARAPDTNLNARRNLMKFTGIQGSYELEELRERDMRYGAKGITEIASHHGWEERRQRLSTRNQVHQPFFGITLVSCERGDMRQSDDGLFIYGENGKTEIGVPMGLRGRQAEIKELYEAVFNGRPLFHSGRWGEATLEVCLGLLRSARDGKEVVMSHQLTVDDTALMAL